MALADPMIQLVQWPWALGLALAIGVIAVWLVRLAIARRRARIAALGTPTMIERLAPGVLARDSSWTPVRLGAAALLVGLAFAGPRWGAEQTVVRQSGIDVVLALDASVSMLANDERPNRLERMKEAVGRLRARSPGDRTALLAFAGRSYILTPLTIDQSGLDLFLDNLDPSVVGQAGSALAPPIRQATTLLSLSTSDADQAIVLMSDGEGFEDEASVLEAAATARERGIHLVTVGFGTTAGSTIPIRENGRTTLKRDPSGALVVTRYDPGLLERAAQTARGVFVAAETPDRATAIRSALDRLRAEPRTVRNRQFLAPRFQWFVLPAFLLLLWDALLASRRGRGRRRAALALRTAALLLAVGCNQFGLMRDAHVAAYNRGTQLLLADSLGPALAARDPLRTALPSRREEVRFRAGFNLGLTHLREGLALQGDSADAPLDSALANYKAVLVLRPADFDAKWNYELALRRRSGGGGGGDGGGGGGGGEAEPQPSPTAEGGITPRPRFGMTVEQAEQLLNAIAREEQDVQGNQQRRSVPLPPPQGKDW